MSIEIWHSLVRLLCRNESLAREGIDMIWDVVSHLYNAGKRRNESLAREGIDMEASKTVTVNVNVVEMSH